MMRLMFKDMIKMKINKLRGVFKQNKPDYPGEEIYDKNGNQLAGIYHKVESRVSDEDVYDKLGNYLYGPLLKLIHILIFQEQNYMIKIE